MIRFHLTRMMAEHKIHVADVAREARLSRVTVTLLYKEVTQKVNLGIIEKLCSLFDFQFSDLLERVLGGTTNSAAN